MTQTLVVCETVHAISLHVRELGDDEEPCYSGRTNPDARTRCGLDVGWDTKIPVENVTRLDVHLPVCHTCRDFAVTRLR